MKLAISTIFALAALLLLGGGARATVIVADGDGTELGSDCTFNCALLYQQVYNRSLFQGVTNIQAVQFKAAQDFTWGANSYEVTLAISAFGVNALSQAFQFNVGPGAAVFQNKSFTGSQSTGDLYGFSGNYSYDPSLGDLLVQIQRTSGVPTSGGAVYNRGIFTLGEYSRFHFIVGPHVDGNYGLHTFFTTGAATSIPTSSTLSLFGSGLAAFGLVGWRTRRRAVAATKPGREQSGGLAQVFSQ